MTNLDLLRNRSASRLGFNDFWSLFDELNRPLAWRMNTDHLAETPRSTAVEVFTFRTDISEVESAFVIQLDAPGMKKEDLSIDVTDRTLKITGERKRAEEFKAEKTFRSESFYGRYQRSFELPDGVDVDRIEASYDAGVLKLVIPKMEAVKPKKIVISEDSKGFLAKLVHSVKEGSKEGAKASNG